MRSATPIPATCGGPLSSLHTHSFGAFGGLLALSTNARTCHVLGRGDQHASEGMSGAVGVVSKTAGSPAQKTDTRSPVMR